MTNEEKQELRKLTQAAHLAISRVKNSPLFSQVEYSPDLTLEDATTALDYLAWELIPENES